MRRSTSCCSPTTAATAAADSKDWSEERPYLVFSKQGILLARFRHREEAMDFAMQGNPEDYKLGYVLYPIPVISRRPPGSSQR